MERERSNQIEITFSLSKFTKVSSRSKALKRLEFERIPCGIWPYLSPLCFKDFNATQRVRCAAEVQATKRGRRPEVNVIVLKTRLRIIML